MEREQVSMSVHDYDMMADSDCESSGGSGSGSGSCSRQLDEFSRNGMARLEEPDGIQSKYSVVKRIFLAGMGSVGDGVNVLAIHKKLYSSVAGRAKLQAFWIFFQAVAEKRGGDANVKYGWYGGSRADICNIVNHGFGRLGDSEMSFPHGIGVYLSPVNLSIDSAMRAEADEDGVRHILLCQVILGDTEIIQKGSKQFQPSSTDLDSGIDNPLSPRKYIVWSAFMNTHIFPKYVISFTLPSLVGRSLNSATKLESPIIMFPVLMNVLSRFLPPSKMDLALKYYNEFKKKKIGKPQLIGRLRSLIGDDGIISVIRLCKEQEN